MTVLDANDNQPQLQLPQLSFTVPENTHPVYVTTATATDDDIGTFSCPMLVISRESPPPSLCQGRMLLYSSDLQWTVTSSPSMKPLVWLPRQLNWTER